MKKKSLIILLFPLILTGCQSYKKVILLVDVYSRLQQRMNVLI